MILCPDATLKVDEDKWQCVTEAIISPGSMRWIHACRIHNALGSANLPVLCRECKGKVTIAMQTGIIQTKTGHGIMSECIFAEYERWAYDFRKARKRIKKDVARHGPLLDKLDTRKNCPMTSPMLTICSSMTWNKLKRSYTKT